MMAKGITFILCVIFTIFIGNTNAACDCTGVCVDQKPYDRVVCIADETGSATTAATTLADAIDECVPDDETNCDDTLVEATACTHYCECKSGDDGTALPCPNFLNFDPITKSCLWQNDVPNCGESSGSEACDPAKCSDTPDTVYNPMISECVQSGTYVCAAEELLPKCATDSIYEKKYISDKEDCSGYYYCEGNRRLKGRCDPNLYFFNPLKQECSYKTSLNCTETGSGSSAAGIDWKNVCNGIVNTFVVDPRHCSAYIYCNGESKPRQAFCPKGQYFSNGQCVKTPPSSCNCEIYDWSVETDDEKYAPNVDQTKFYICKKGERIEEKCFPGTIWSQKYESCVFP